MFQFHKVRLKEKWDCIHDAQRWFQFHKVRLKEQYRGGAVDHVTKFQFHKVRLKVRNIVFYMSRMRMFQFHKVRLKVPIPDGDKQPDLVSIPQGTIKSFPVRL